MAKYKRRGLNVRYAVTKERKFAFSALSGSKNPPRDLTITVTPNVAPVFTQLQVLLPGETAAPGTPSGKTGTPTDQVTGVSFNIVVNATDGYWNLNTTATDTIHLASTDGSATLAANHALVAGTWTFAVTLGTDGRYRITASDVTDATKGQIASALVTTATAVSSGYVRKGSISAGSSGGAGADVTTGTLDCTGVNLITIAVSSLSSVTAPTVQDSQENTYTARNPSVTAGAHSRVEVFDCYNPTVTSSMTFNTLNGGSPTYSSIAVIVYSGAAPSPHDAETLSKADAGSSSLTTGLIQPSVDNELLVTALCTEGTTGTVTIDQFTIRESIGYLAANHFPIYFADLIQTTKSDVTATWSFAAPQPTSSQAASETYKAA